MELTQEQTQQVKEQLLKQLDNFPEDKREQIKKEIMSMSNQDVENFIKQNKLDHLQECVFCSIIKNKIPSYKIDENQNNIAILEINPLTKGHALIIPKSHLDKTPDSAKELAKKVAKKIQQTLNPKQIEIQENKIMEHSLIEIIPIYDQEPNKRKKASEKDLKKLQQDLVKSKPEKRASKRDTPELIKIKKQEPIPKLKARIP